MKKLWSSIFDLAKSQKNLASVGVADFTGVALSAVFWFYLASLTEADKFGEVHYFIGIAGIAYTISLVGTQNSITVFTAKNLKIESTLFFMSLIAGTIAAIILLIIFLSLDLLILRNYGIILDLLFLGLN